MNEADKILLEKYQETYGTLEISSEMIDKKFLSVCTPDIITSRAHMALPRKEHGYVVTSDIPMFPEDLVRLYRNGTAVCEFIDNHMAQDHPDDKRFLLRHLENVSLRHGLREQRVPGFSHDVIYSRTPLLGYKTFDNTLYYPPLTGYWAIARRASRD
jgi:hypothetical protein